MEGLQSFKLYYEECNQFALILPVSTMQALRARICRPFKEPKNRFPAWRAGTTTLFVVPALQAT
jgi:hypothetical protein